MKWSIFIISQSLQANIKPTKTVCYKGNPGKIKLILRNSNVEIREVSPHPTPPPPPLPPPPPPPPHTHTHTQPSLFTFTKYALQKGRLLKRKHESKARGFLQ